MPARRRFGSPCREISGWGVDQVAGDGGSPQQSHSSKTHELRAMNAHPSHASAAASRSWQPEPDQPRREIALAIPMRSRPLPRAKSGPS